MINDRVNELAQIKDKNQKKDLKNKIQEIKEKSILKDAKKLIDLSALLS